MGPVMGTTPAPTAPSGAVGIVAGASSSTPMVATHQDNSERSGSHGGIGRGRRRSGVAQTSVLAEYCGQSEYDNQAQRVVAGQHLCQAASDIFLGWQRTVAPDGVTRDFYVRQLRDGKYSIPVETLPPGELTQYARFCGWTLARAHARSGDRIAIAAYLGKSDTFAQAVADFAEAYADQTERDHAALADAVTQGRAEVTEL